jgi:hypothetical protein
MGGLAEEVLIEIVADMLVAETTRRSSSVIILPVFMVVGDVKMAEVVVEVVPGGRGSSRRRGLTSTSPS